MNRRSALVVLLSASGWANMIVEHGPSQPPSLSIAIGGQDGFSELVVFINNERFDFTPEDIAKALRNEQ